MPAGTHCSMLPYTRERRRLEPPRLVDEVAQWSPGGEAFGVVEQHLEPAVVEIGAVPGGMRGQQHARHRPQSVRRRQRLDLVDVERRARDLLGLQRRR